MKKTYLIKCVTLLFFIVLLAGCPTKKPGVERIITLKNFDESWMKGNWDVVISRTTEEETETKNFTVKILDRKGEGKVEIIDSDNSVEITDIEGLKDKIYFYYVSDIPGAQDIAELEKSGKTVTDNGALHLSGNEDKVFSSIKITNLSGRYEELNLLMTNQ